MPARMICKQLTYRIASLNRLAMLSRRRTHKIGILIDEERYMNPQSKRNLWIWPAPVALALVLFGVLLTILPANARSTGGIIPDVAKASTNNPECTGAACQTIASVSMAVFEQSGSSLSCFATITETIVYTSVQAAVDAVADNATVKVAGTCEGVTARGGMSQTVAITRPLTIRGGYTTTNWTISYPITQPTVLDANRLGRVISATVSITVANLTIQNGYVITGSTGGGIFANGALTLTNVNVLSNTAVSATSIGGGGVRVNGALWVTGGRFENNRVTSSGSEGGAIYSGTPSNPDVTISGTIFISNSANHGGAISLAANAWLTGTQFISNTATTGITTGKGGGVFNNTSNTMSLFGARFERNWAAGRGGGVCSASQVEMVDTQFISNTANSGSGGGLYAGSVTIVSSSQFTNNTSGSSYSGGGLYASGALTVTDTSLADNKAGGFGGGLYGDSTVTITGTDFISNTSGSSGGGLYGSTVTITGTDFISNTSRVNGGGLYAGGVAIISSAQFINNNANTGRGGGLYASSKVTVSSVRLTNNAAESGGGLYANTDTTIANTQFTRNTAANGGGGYFAARFDSTRIDLVNVLLDANSAIINGAALSLFEPSPPYGFGKGGTATILYTTIASPTVGTGQAIFVGKPYNAVTATITNTIIASYTTGISVTTGVTFSSDYNYFNNAPDHIDIGSHSISGTDHYLLFADAVAGDYRPAVGSPAPTHGISMKRDHDLSGNPAQRPAHHRRV